MNHAKVVALRIRDEARPLPRLKPLYRQVPRGDGNGGDMLMSALLYAAAVALFVGPLAWWLHGLLSR